MYSLTKRRRSRPLESSMASCRSSSHTLTMFLGIIIYSFHKFLVSKTIAYSSHILTITDNRVLFSSIYTVGPHNHVLFSYFDKVFLDHGVLFPSFDNACPDNRVLLFFIHTVGPHNHLLFSCFTLLVHSIMYSFHLLTLVVLTIILTLHYRKLGNT
jgi:hypothetical protein